MRRVMGSPAALRSAASVAALGDVRGADVTVGLGALTADVRAVAGWLALLLAVPQPARTRAARAAATIRAFMTVHPAARAQQRLSSYGAGAVATTGRLQR